jgi:hypothetical protein
MSLDTVPLADSTPRSSHSTSSLMHQRFDNMESEAATFRTFGISAGLSRGFVGIWKAACSHSLNKGRRSTDIALR